MALIEEAESSQRTAQPSIRIRAKRDGFLFVCRCFSFVTALAAILCVFVNVLSAIRCFRKGKDIFGGIFRCYAVAIALFVVVSETEWSFILKFCKIMEYWAGRGMLQIFVAVMTRAFPNTNGEIKVLILLQEIVSYVLLGCGVCYVILGLLCMSSLKRSLMKKEVTREQAVKDLEELQKRREELEALLIVDSIS